MIVEEGYLEGAVLSGASLSGREDDVGDSGDLLVGSYEQRPPRIFIP